MIKEFRPALVFLLKFLGVYIVGNLSYGAFISHYYPGSDPFTYWIAEQVGFLCSVFGPIEVTTHSGMATISLVDKLTHRTVINIYEGCNGINVAIVFLSFLFAFRGTLGRTLIFSMLGLLVIHAVNLGRIVMLFQQARIHSQYFYYVHKYLFTAVIYAIVLLMWWLWASKVNGLKKE